MLSISERLERNRRFWEGARVDRVSSWTGPDRREG